MAGEQRLVTSGPTLANLILLPEFLLAGFVVFGISLTVAIFRPRKGKKALEVNYGKALVYFVRRSLDGDQKPKQDLNLI